MRLIKHTESRRIWYTIEDVSMLDLAILQLMLIESNHQELRVGKVWDRELTSTQVRCYCGSMCDDEAAAKVCHAFHQAPARPS